MKRSLWYEIVIPGGTGCHLGGVARAPPPANAANELALSVEKNRDPVHSRRIRGIAGVAGADRKLLNARIAQQT